MDSELIPVFFVVVVVHEIVEEFVVLIDATWYDEKFSINALAVECATWGFRLGELVCLEFVGFEVNDFYCVSDEAETLLEVVVSAEADYFFVLNHAGIGLTEAFHPRYCG